MKRTQLKTLPLQAAQSEGARAFYNMDELKHNFRELLDEGGSLPADMLALLRQVAAYDPLLLANLDPRYVVAWRGGRELAEGRAVLQALSAYVTAQRRKERDATATAHI